MFNEFYCYLIIVAYTQYDKSVLISHWQKFKTIKQTTYVIQRNKLRVVTAISDLRLQNLSPVVSSCSKHDVSLRFLQSSSGNKS